MSTPLTQYARRGDAHLAFRRSGPPRAGRAGEVLVTRTARDLVAGSGIGFEERGEDELKGVPDRWTLYAAADAPSSGVRA